MSVRRLYEEEEEEEEEEEPQLQLPLHPPATRNSPLETQSVTTPPWKTRGIRLFLA
jgi:hypothetical protein